MGWNNPVQRITFQEFKRKLTIKTFCRICKKKLTRVIEDSQTLNPYNKNGV